MFSKTFMPLYSPGGSQFVDNMADHVRGLLFSILESLFIYFPNVCSVYSQIL